MGYLQFRPACVTLFLQLVMRAVFLRVRKAPPESVRCADRADDAVRCTDQALETINDKRAWEKARKRGRVRPQTV